MISAFDYWEEDGKEVVARVYGRGVSALLPEKAGEITLRELADHAFSPSPSDEMAKKEIFRAVRREGSEAENASGWTIGRAEDLPAPDDVLCGEKVEEIALPASMSVVGNYAFYGCRNLASLTFPPGRIRMGSGAFVDCGHIRKLTFTCLKGETDPPQLREVLGDMNLEVEVTVTDGENTVLKLYYPGYYEDSVENTPARIFIMHYEGTGFKYRQCFKNGKIDFDQYDSLFYETSVQETTDTALRVAFDRLTWPVHLSQKSREKYFDFILTEYRAAAPVILKEERTALLEILCGSERMPKEIFERFLETAREMRSLEALGILQEIRRKRFPAKKKEYRF